MLACKFPGARVIGAPDGWDHELDGSCGEIYVADAVDVLSGRPVMYSVYKPTAEELEALLAGGGIRLGIIGRAHPVFQLQVVGTDIMMDAQARPVWDTGPVVHLPTKGNNT